MTRMIQLIEAFARLVTIRGCSTEAQNMAKRIARKCYTNIDSKRDFDLVDDTIYKVTCLCDVLEKKCVGNFKQIVDDIKYPFKDGVQRVIQLKDIDIYNKPKQVNSPVYVEPIKHQERNIPRPTGPKVEVHSKIVNNKQTLDVLSYIKEMMYKVDAEDRARLKCFEDALPYLDDNDVAILTKTKVDAMVA